MIQERDCVTLSACVWGDFDWFSACGENHDPDRIKMSDGDEQKYPLQDDSVPVGHAETKSMDFVSEISHDLLCQSRLASCDEFGHDQAPEMQPSRRSSKVFLGKRFAGGRIECFIHPCHEFIVRSL